MANDLQELSDEMASIDDLHLIRAGAALLMVNIWEMVESGEWRSPDAANTYTAALERFETVDDLIRRRQEMGEQISIRTPARRTELPPAT